MIDGARKNLTGQYEDEKAYECAVAQVDDTASPAQEAYILNPEHQR